MPEGRPEQTGGDQEKQRLLRIRTEGLASGSLGSGSGRPEGQERADNLNFPPGTSSPDHPLKPFSRV